MSISASIWRRLLFNHFTPVKGVTYCTHCRRHGVLVTTSSGSGRGSKGMLKNVRYFSVSHSLRLNLPRIVVEPTAAAKEAFEDPEFKTRKSPGHFKVKKVSLPPKFKEAAKTIIKVQGFGDLRDEALTLYNQLKNRKPPVEDQEYQRKAAAVEASVKEEHAYVDQFLSEEEKQKLETADFRKIKKRLKQLLYHWEPINYTKMVAFKYLVGRTPGEYASLYRIFFELAQRDPDFKPETLLDFGSGVGSVIWAANQFWKKSLTEHMCIDSSDEMTNLSDLLLRGGSQKFPTEYKGIYFRRLLPTSTHRKYDMTVSSHTLLELSSVKDRIEVIDTLWKKTNKYMVLVELGTNAGFGVLNEAREYILQLHDGFGSGNEQKFLDFEEGHMFSPCPHDLHCPRRRTDHTPCNFSIRHEQLMPFSHAQEGVELFSYLVFKKGLRDKDSTRWPRIVRDPLRRPRHVVCRLCTKQGNISEAVISKGKYQRELYRTARTSLWGDLLPVDEMRTDSTSMADNLEPEAQHTDLDSDSHSDSDSDNAQKTASERNDK